MNISRGLRSRYTHRKHKIYTAYLLFCRQLRYFSSSSNNNNLCTTTWQHTFEKTCFTSDGFCWRTLWGSTPQPPAKIFEANVFSSRGVEPRNFPRRKLPIRIKIKYLRWGKSGHPFRVFPTSSFQFQESQGGSESPSTPQVYWYLTVLPAMEYFLVQDLFQLSLPTIHKNELVLQTWQTWQSLWESKVGFDSPTTSEPFQIFHIHIISYIIWLWRSCTSNSSCRASQHFQSNLFTQTTEKV